MPLCSSSVDIHCDVMLKLFSPLWHWLSVFAPIKFFEIKSVTVKCNSIQFYKPKQSVSSFRIFLLSVMWTCVRTNERTNDGSMDLWIVVVNVSSFFHKSSFHQHVNKMKQVSKQFEIFVKFSTHFRKGWEHLFNGNLLKMLSWSLRVGIFFPCRFCAV